MKQLTYLFTVLVLAGTITACKKKDDSTDGNNSSDEPKLVFRFKFDATQPRLDNFGNPETVPAGNAAQSPTFHYMGAHYIELSKENDIPAYNGTELYNSPTTTEGGDKAIDFDKAILAKEGEDFFTMNLKDVPAGTYKYLRVSLSYQNYDIDFVASGLDLKGRIASFVGANSYIRSYKVKDSTVTVNANKLQGHWAFETDFPGVPVITGDAPGTTVPNPIAATSAIPPGSCLVTGVFPTPFTVTGNETEDVVITVSVSTNNSFEWKDTDGDGKYGPQNGDTVVDMGVRGLIPMVGN